MSVLKALYIVTLDTTNGVLRIYYTLSPRRFEVSRLITLHSRQEENKPIYIWHMTESFLLAHRLDIVAQTQCPRLTSIYSIHDDVTLVT